MGDEVNAAAYVGYWCYYHGVGLIIFIPVKRERGDEKSQTVVVMKCLCTNIYFQYNTYLLISI